MPQEKQAQAGKTTEEKGILETMLEKLDDEKAKALIDAAGTALDSVSVDAAKRSKDWSRAITAHIAEIDQDISDQLNAIMHHPEFQKLESSWRGLKYLVQNSETNATLKIRVMNASKQELFDDMDNATDFDQSALFKKVYTEEYDQLGGDPFGVLIGDYEFGDKPQDVAFLQGIAGVAAGAHAPFVSAAAPGLFSLESFADVVNPRDLEKIFRNKNEAKYVEWASFRDSEDSRYVALTLPRVLIRKPYGKDTVPVETFDFTEDVDGRDHDKYLWSNAAYAFGARLTEAFAKYGWCAKIRGVEGGGVVEGLPVHSFKTDEGDVAMKCPTEVAIPGRREGELSELGFLALLHRKGTDQAAFMGAQTVNKPKKYDDPRATGNADLSAKLPYMLSICRIAHYLKVIMRDKIGSFMSREECQTYLNRWITQYVSTDDNASAETKAQKPLRAAEILVEDDLSRPGCYKAVAYLRPHFQLEKIEVSLRLVTELPAPGK